MTLKHEIGEWDKRSVHFIRGIYKRHSSDQGFFNQLIALMNDVPLQGGVTWLMKYHLNNSDYQPTAKQAHEIYNNTIALNDWDGQLHILQIMSRLPIAENQQKEVENFLRKSITSKVKFVRAWAYDGFYQLACQHPDYRPQAEILFNDAIENEAAPSVIARVRNIWSQGFKP